MEINYFFEEIESFTIIKEIKEMIIIAFEKEGKEGGEINYIFCSDKYLLKINKEYLEHDYYTDIITFDNSEQSLISGDIFISKERVEENSNQYGVSFENELNRLMVHGLRHLFGYNDATQEEKNFMRLKEEQYMI